MKKVISFGNYVLQAADVVVVRRITSGLFDHYLIYVGDGLFIANMRSGIIQMSIRDLEQFAGIYKPIRLRPFHGNEWQRHQAFQRANECLGRPYSLLFNNCEHFADYIQFGRHSSLQSAKAGFGLVTMGALIASRSKNEAVQFLGGLSIAAGILALINESINTNSSSENPFSYKIS